MSVLQARTVDLQILQNALDIIAGFARRNFLDPVDGIDIGVARIADLPHPFAYTMRAGIITGQSEDIGSVERVDLILDEGAADAQAEIFFAQAFVLIGKTKFLCDASGR